MFHARDNECIYALAMDLSGLFIHLWNNDVACVQANFLPQPVFCIWRFSCIIHEYKMFSESLLLLVRNVDCFNVPGGSGSYNS